MNGQAGKGDSPRPRFISDEQYAKNWELAFGKRKQKKVEKKSKK